MATDSWTVGQGPGQLDWQLVQLTAGSHRQLDAVIYLLAKRRIYPSVMTNFRAELIPTPHNHKRLFCQTINLSFSFPVYHLVTTRTTKATLPF